ncbi:hypothetical protein [Streptomyces sp. NPDC088196]|uniref:hypothetical protein n=1 Tax=Streptomyces sp. NPDC088196 TaxID=3154868 RepID=UPI00344F761C
MTSHNSLADNGIRDPFDTLHRALRIGGGQWAGKPTVARPRELPRAASPGITWSRSRSTPSAPPAGWASA